MAPKAPKLGVPVQQSSIVFKEYNPDDYVGDRWIQPEAPAPEEQPKQSGLIRRIAGDGIISAMKGAIGVPEAAVGLADIATGGYAGKLAEDAGFRPQEARNILDQYYSPEQKAANAAVQNAANPEDGLGQRILDTGAAALRNPSTIVHGVVESLPVMGAGGVIGRGLMAVAPKAATWAAGGVGEGVTSMGSTAEQIRQGSKDGLLTGEQSLVAAGSGALTGTLGILSGKIANKLGIGDPETLLVGGIQPEKEAVKKTFIRQFLEGAFTEGVLEELPQSVQEQVAQNYAMGKPLDEGVDQAVVMGVLSGGAMGAGAQILHRNHVPEAGPLSRAANAGIDAAGPVIVPPAPPPLAPEQAQTLLDHANARAREIEQKAKGTKDEKIPGPDGKPVTVPGLQPEFLTPAEKEELAFLKENGGDAQALAQAYPGLASAPAVAHVPDALPEQAPAAPPASAAELPQPTAEAFAQREADRPAEPIGAVMDGDILNPRGQPFKNMASAMTAQKKAGDTHEIVRVADGLVVRQKVPNGTTDGTPAGTATGATVPANQPTASVDAGTGTQPEPTTDAGRPGADVMGQAGALPSGGSDAAVVQPNNTPAASTQSAPQGVTFAVASGNIATQDASKVSQPQGSTNESQAPQAIQATQEGSQAPAADKPVTDKYTQIEQGFAKNREALKSLKVGDDVEFTQPGAYTQADGSKREGRVVRGKVEKIIDKDQGTVKVGNHTVSADSLRKVEAGQDDYGPRWNRMTTIEREAVAKLAGLKKIPAAYVSKRGWQGLDTAAQDNLKKGMDKSSPAPIKETGAGFEPVGRRAFAEGKPRLAPNELRGLKDKSIENEWYAGWDAAKTEAAKDNGQNDWTVIGRNKDGKLIVADKRGVRSYVENGIRVTESVSMRPTSSGMALSTEHKGEFLTVEEDTSSKQDAPGTRVNGDTERQAADRLERLHAQMSNITERNSREGNAKAAVRGVIDELRKPKTVSSVDAILEKASNDLLKNYGAFSDVIDSVVDGLQGRNDELDAEMQSYEAKADKAPAAPAPHKPKRHAGARHLRSIGYSKNPLMSFLATHGLYHESGKSGSQKAEYSPDRSILVSGYGPVFKRTGKNPSDLVVQAIEDGYLPKDGTVAQLDSLIRRAISGEKISPMYAEGVAEAEMQARMDADFEDFVQSELDSSNANDYDPFESVSELGYALSDAEQSGYSEADDPIKIEVNALLKQAEALGIDIDTIKEDAHYANPEGSEQDYYEAARNALQEAITTSRGNSGTDDGSTGNAGSQDEGLTFTTPEQVKADEERAAKAAKAEKAQRAAQDLIDKKERERKDIAKASEAAADTFTLGGDAEQNLTGQQDVFGQPEPAPAKPDALSEKEKAAKAKMFGALGKLAALAGKNTRMNWTPEQEQQLLPIVIELFDGAMELGSVTFQKAVRYVREFIASNLDQETADAIPFETLQGAYIHTARKYKDQGATTGKEVMGFDSLADLEKAAPTEAEGITKIIERIDGADGMYVNIANNTTKAGGFNVVLRDGDSEETVGAYVNVPTMEDARAQARKMLNIKDAAAAPTPAPAPAPASAPELVTYVTAKGKTLQGVVRTDLSYKQAKEIDRFTFKKDGGYFIREQHLDALNAAYPQQAASQGDRPTLETTEGRHAIAQLVADALIGGTTFATIIEARKFIADKTGSAQAQPGTDLAKRADEAIELGVVMASREVVEAARKQGRSDDTIFNRLIGIYKAQPSLNVRDSVSLRNQAYSTPVPLAFVASRLANVTPQKKVGEPTGGNGALLIEANPATTTVNEIQDDRLEALRSQGFNPTQNDASTMTFAPKSLDAMVMNPPFGPLNGQKWTFGDFTTGEIDHAIALNSLQALKDEGDAVMIIGGTLAQDDNERKLAYRGKAKREFFYTLYNQYNVVDHFTVSGDLYKKQGAAFPVDVLVIRGRGKSSRGLPAAQLPQLINTWDQLLEKLNEASSVGTQGAGSAGGSVTANGVNNSQPTVPAAVDAAPGGVGVGFGPVGLTTGVGSSDGSGSTPSTSVSGGITGASNSSGQRGNAVTPAPTGSAGGIAPQVGGQQPGRTNSARSDQSGRVDAGSRVGVDKSAIEEAANSGKLQVKYQNFSGNRSVNTLVATNHLSAIENAFTNLRSRVGDIDEFVRAELQYEPEQFRKAFSAEQVEALALAIDNISQGKGFIIGDQTGIGKGRVVAAMIRHAKLNGKTPVFVTQMPDLYGDMMRDLNDIGMGNTIPLMTNNNASVPLDKDALDWFGEKQGINARITELLDEMEAVALADLGDLSAMEPDARSKAIATALKTSTNPEMVSLRDEIKELKASMPERRGKFLDTPSIETHEKALQKMVSDGNIGNHDVIFTTYNQMAALDSGKPKKDKETGAKIPAKAPVFGYRSTFLNHFVNDKAMLILDESHNAGEAGDGRFPKVGDVVRRLISQSGGVFYSSATFAKNTAVMDVYSKTDLGSAFANPHDLVDAINSVPMQQITSAMLVEAGQYLRRERSFDGIEYKTDTVKVDQDAAEDVSTAMRLVVAFDKAKKAAIADLQNQLDQEGAAIATVNGGGSQASVDSTNFTSVMHNVVNTFLLALKADAAANSAIEAIKSGEKPVITVANTMEMFITEYAKDAGLGIGDKLNATFADVLKRYLQKTRKANIKHANGDSEVVELSDQQLGPDGVDAYEAAFDFIDGMDMDIPLSPIDHIKQKIEEAGFSIGEITGRQTVVVEGVLKGRNKAELNTAGKKNTIAKFNGGQIDALIINRSGSTGLSMHASETFEDQRRRVMIVAQAELDINNHMQMLGRINRTGQVTENGKNPTGGPGIFGLPRYAQMTANVPIELRPAAVLSNKMAGLNANTTAGRKGAVQDQSALDFMNKYGDRVAAELVGGNSMLNERLGYPIKFDEHGAPFVPGSIARVTGRIGLLPLADQNELYGQLSNEYGELITQLDALGQNDLEAKTYPLDADTVENKVVQKADKGAPSPFTSSVVAEKVSMKKLGKPYSKAKVLELLAASLDGKNAQALRRKTLEDVSSQIRAEVQTLQGAMASGDANERNAIQKHIDALNTASNRFVQTLPAIGAEIVLKTDAGNMYGVVTNIDRTGKAKSAGSLSAWKIKIAVVDGARSMTLPLTQIYTDESQGVPDNGIVMKPASEMTLPNAERNGFDTVPVLDAFDRGQTDTRETRVIITGNILRGYGALRGRLLNYTDNKGNIKQGILMPADFDMNAVMARFTPVLKNASAVIDLLDRGGVAIDKANAGDTLRIQKAGGAYTIAVSKTGLGKRLAKNAGELNFVSSGNKMRVRVWDSGEVADFIENTVSKEGISLIPDANSVKLMEGDTDGAVFSMRDSAPEQKLSLEQIERLVKSALRDVQNAPVVRVVASPEAIGLRSPVNTIPSGVVLSNGDIYVFQSGIGSTLEVDQVIFHELFHKGLQNVIPKADYVAAMQEIASTDSKVRQYAGEWSDSNAGKAALTELAKKFGGKELADQYEALATEEGLAMLAEDLKAKRTMGARAMNGTVKRVVNWLAKLSDKIGMTRLADRLRAMSYSDAEKFVIATISKSGGKGGPDGGNKLRAIDDKTGAPRFRSLNEALTDGVNNVRDVRLPAGYQIGDLFQGEGRLHWWHKSVGSMFHLAEKSPAFKRVYDSIQNFLNDVSYYAAEAADLAPNILPKLDKMSDVFKSPLSAEDTKTLSAPVFAGTLTWGRDKNGKATPMDDIEASLAHVPLDERAHMLLQARHVDPKVLKMWQGLEQDQYEAIINNKFEREFMKPGVVFTPAELAKHFNMTPAQVKLYQEFRAATDKSIDHLAISEMLNYAGKDADGVRDQIIDMDDVEEAGQTLRDYLVSLVDMFPERDEGLSATAAKMLDIAAHATDMKNRGYAPLSRFGTYTLEATLPTGERYFSLFETDRERNKMRRLLADDGATSITTGTMSQEAYKLLNGISPETAALFGEMLGLDSQGTDAKDLAYQQYIKLGTANRSAMKRLLHRKGIAGFSEDAGRVLAGFVYSNARRTASNLHNKETSAAVADIPKEQGELKDAAVKLQEYVSNPQEEMQTFRGILFAQYLGGSIASAMINATQPFAVTLPYLSQFGGIRKAAAQMAAAVKDATKDKTGDARLDAALKKAEEEGIVSPQEVHSLQAQAMGKSQLQAGDGTFAGNALAKGNNALSKLSLAWGKVFGLAEQFNRRTTFIAAYRTAREQGMANPAAFAEKAVNETQFTYNKGNKPRWARGAVGSVLFTFKQYSVNYLELVTRMATAGQPGSPERLAGQKAALLAIAVLFMLSGADGLPFVEDIEDLIDGAMQRLGYNFNSKQRMKSFLVNQLGKDGADFVSSGLSGLPGMPIDVSGRLGMANLIPGTGLLLKKADHTRDLMEFAGPGGDFAKRAFNATEQALGGNVGEAIATVAPNAARNVVKAIDMGSTGMYRDDKGRKVIDTTPGEAVLKGLGFQPRNVKEVQDASYAVQRSKDQYAIAASEIRQKMANAIFMNDSDMKQAARDDIAAWNNNNPDQRMILNMPAVLTKVREMRKTKEQRMADTAPKAIRSQVREQLRENLS